MVILLGQQVVSAGSNAHKLCECQTNPPKQPSTAFVSGIEDNEIHCSSLLVNGLETSETRGARQC